MDKFYFLALVFAFTFVVALSPINGQTAPRCPTGADNATCDLPDCRCSVTSIPGDLTPVETPQIVLFSFDSAINVGNFPMYMDLLGGRINPNGAEISATFFISHEYNDYNLTHEIYRQGHEIALNSITRFSSTDYWKSLNESMWTAEIVDQRLQMSFMANISIDDIKGMRAPFLQIGGDEMYSALYAGEIAWESSRPTWNMRQPGLWPYTADYLSTQDCQIPLCPTESYPGFWTVPMIDFIGPDNFPCPIIDQCNPRPTTANDTFLLLRSNFLDQYLGNKAPFGVSSTSAFLQGSLPEFQARIEGYKMFLDYLATLPDVHIVSISKALEWIKSPTPLSDIVDFVPWQPESIKADHCPLPRSCRFDFQGSERYMMACLNQCPPQYPWLHNPLGSSV